LGWTYDSDLPTDKDRVRFLIGDTDANDPIMQDGEINYVLTVHANVNRAAAACCRAIAAKLRRELTLNPAAGSISLDPQKQADGFIDLANELEQQALTSGGAGIFGGGISKTSKAAQESSSDRVKPAFTVDTHHVSSPVDSRLMES